MQLWILIKNMFTCTFLCPKKTDVKNNVPEHHESNKNDIESRKVKDVSKGKSKERKKKEKKRSKLKDNENKELLTGKEILNVKENTVDNNSKKKRLTESKYKEELSGKDKCNDIQDVEKNTMNEDKKRKKLIESKLEEVSSKIKKDMDENQLNKKILRKNNSNEDYNKIVEEKRTDRRSNKDHKYKIFKTKSKRNILLPVRPDEEIKNKNNPYINLIDEYSKEENVYIISKSLKDLSTSQVSNETDFSSDETEVSCVISFHDKKIFEKKLSRKILSFLKYQDNIKNKTKKA